MKRNLLKYVLSILMIMIYTLPIWASPDNPPAEEDPVDPTPIDEFLPWLLFIGLLLGILIKMSNKPDILKN